VPGVLLDVNETLLDLRGLQPTFEAMGMSDALPLWFATTLRNGFALAAAGDYRPFSEVAVASLHSLNPRANADVLLAGFGELAPHPDVEEGLRALADAGIPAMTLTVGSAEIIARIFDRNGLGDLVTGHLSVDEVHRWKPAAAPYLSGCLALGLAPKEVTMVAAHSWDLHGARRAGLRTAWISRLEGTRPEIFDAADIEGPDLPSVATAIVAAS
jgi:2-haloacid dehalogenase